jgi:hypothetical protein
LLPRRRRRWCARLIRRRSTEEEPGLGRTSRAAWRRPAVRSPSGWPRTGEVASIGDPPALVVGDTGIFHVKMYFSLRTSHQQPASSTLLSEETSTSTSHQPLAWKGKMRSGPCASVLLLLSCQLHSSSSRSSCPQHISLSSRYMSALFISDMLPKSTNTPGSDFKQHRID